MESLMLSLCWLLVAAAAIDLERSVSIAGRNATGTFVSVPMEEEQGRCSHFTETKVKPDVVYHDTIKRIRLVDHGRLNGSMNFTATSWRLICPQRHYMAVVVLRMNISSEEYALNIKHLQLTGCIDIPHSYLFNKKSIMFDMSIHVTEPAATDIDVGVICIRQTTTLFAQHMLLNHKTMEFIKSHPGSYEKIAHLLSHPETIVEASQSNDPEMQEILNLTRENEDQLRDEVPLSTGKYKVDGTSGSGGNE